MTNPHSHGALRTEPGASDWETVWVSDTDGPALAGDEGTAAVLAQIGALSVQVAEIARRLDTIAGSTTALRTDVESMSAVVQGCAVQRAAATQKITSMIDRSQVSSDEVAAQAVLLSTARIERAHHHPLRAALVMLEARTTQLEESIKRGRLLSISAVEETFAEAECPFGRWLRSGRADALDPARAREIRPLHADLHHVASQVLAEVKAGQVDEARRLMESEEGYTGAARRLNDIVTSWIDALCQQGASKEV